MGMKATAKPEMSKKWWTTEKPCDIKGGDLEKALAGAEKALAEEVKKGDSDAINSCLIALQGLESAVDKTIKKECDKKKHKEVITVLEKYYATIKSEVRRLEEAKAKFKKDECEKDDEDEEADEGKLFEKDYLYKMIKMMKSTGKQLNFGFGVNTNSPEACVLLLARKGKPEKLFRALKQTGDFSNRLLTCGLAMPDPENGKVLLLRLEDGANEPPQILKMGRQFLRSDKGLRFRKLKVVIPGGHTLIDDEPDEDENAGGGEGARQTGGYSDSAGLEVLLRSAATAADVWKRSRESADNEIAQLRRELAGFDEPGIAEIRDGLATLFDGYPNLEFAALARAGDQAVFDRSLELTRRGLVQWRRMLERDPAIRAIDENPFVKTNLVGRFGDALGVVSDQLKF